MASFVGRLTARQVQTLGDGKHPDRGGLYLQVAGQSRSWLFRYWLAERDAIAGELVRDANGKVIGRDRWMGLGSCEVVTLQQARQRAFELRQTRAGGAVDPIGQREQSRRQAAIAQAKAVKFEHAANALIDSRKAGWTPRHLEQWRSSLALHAYPILGAVPVQDIDTGLIAKAVEPLWQTKTETASRVLRRIGEIIDFATVRGFRVGDNPATLLATTFPSKAKVAPVKHMPALDYREIPAFMALLRQRENMASRALEFLILTCARSEQCLAADWSEIDLVEKTWTISAARMKARQEHIVPLSPRAVEILQQIGPRQVGFIFQNDGARLGDNALFYVLRSMKRSDITAHGFRSSFRTWCGDATSFERETAELALAHAFGGATERAYRRGSALEKRAKLMAAWSAYCSDETASGANVVAIRG